VIVNPSGFSSTVFLHDPAPRTIFTGGGSKDEEDVSQWQWKNGSVPDKDNLLQAFATVHTLGGTYVPNNGTRDGHKLLFFGANRDAVNGDANIGFWFFRNKIGTPGTGATGTPFSGVHAIGDVLILTSFTKGGTVNTMQVFVVTDGPFPDGSVTLEQPFGVNTTSNARVCLTVDEDACASSNQVASPAIDPALQAKNGALGSYAPLAFFEGGIDLTRAGELLGLPLGGECLASFLVETRSSQSITAVLKDFVLGDFEPCEAGITTQIRDASNAEVTHVASNTVIHDFAIVSKNGDNPLPTGTVTFKLYNGTVTTGACTGANPTSTVTVPLFTGTHAVTGEVCPADKACATTLDPTGGVPAGFTATAPGLEFSATYNGDSNYDPVTISACEVLTASTPSIDVSKECTAAVNGDGTTVTVSYSGQVCNTGEEVLTITSFTDSKDSTIENPPASTIPIPAANNPGCADKTQPCCVAYSGSYTSSTASNSDTVTVQASGAAGSTVSDTATATCSPTLTRGITVAKRCANYLVQNSSTQHWEVKVNFGGEVCNTGNTVVTIGSIVDDPAAELPGITLSSTTLGPKNSATQCATYSGSYFPTIQPSGTSGGEGDKVTVSGTAALYPLNDNAVGPTDGTASCDLCPLNNGTVPPAP
jgi:hypothetical protein